MHCFDMLFNAVNTCTSFVTTPGNVKFLISKILVILATLLENQPITLEKVGS